MLDCRGDCDDTMDPTIVFHGVTEDPCWTLTSRDTERKCDHQKKTSGGGGGGLARNCGGNGVGGMVGSPHSTKNSRRLFSEQSAPDDDDDDDIYPIMVGRCNGGGGGASAINMIPTSVMNNRRLAGCEGSEYSFRPEHVPPHIIHRSYSQSMEDLRYLE